MDYEAKILHLLTEMKTDMSEMKTDISGMKSELAEMKTDISGMKIDIRNLQEGQTRLEHSVARIEHDHGAKIAALFDGYTLRGDQIEQLKNHLDERLDTMQNDLSFVVAKVSQHDLQFVRLNKLAKSVC